MVAAIDFCQTASVYQWLNIPIDICVCMSSLEKKNHSKFHTHSFRPLTISLKLTSWYQLCAHACRHLFIQYTTIADMANRTFEYMNLFSFFFLSVVFHLIQSRLYWHIFSITECSHLIQYSQSLQPRWLGWSLCILWLLIS